MISELAGGPKENLLNHGADEEGSNPRPAKE